MGAPPLVPLPWAAGGASSGAGALGAGRGAAGRGGAALLPCFRRSAHLQDTIHHSLSAEGSENPKSNSFLFTQNL